MSSLKNLQIILVRAENPINIGQCARAMKNFGISKLTLVNCAPHKVESAYTVGWKGRKILDQAKRLKSLAQALKKVSLAVGFTARPGKRRGAPSAFHKLVPEIREGVESGAVALVFGNEKNGLSNEEISKCHLMATLPASKEYSSLNLSHAVAIASFLMFQELPEAKDLFKKPERFYTKPAEFKALMADFRNILKLLGYKDGHDRDLLSRVHEQIEHYFKKTGLERRELHLFKAMLSRMRERLI